MTNPHDIATTKIDHVKVVQALRKMEQYQEKHFPVEALDGSYPYWKQIIDYIEGRERKLQMGKQLGLPTAAKAADILLGRAPNENAFGEIGKPARRLKAVRNDKA